MLTEKDLWGCIPSELRDVLSAVLERHQRHLMVLEVEVAEIKDALFELNTHLGRFDRDEKKKVL